MRKHTFATTLFILGLIAVNATVTVYHFGKIDRAGRWAMHTHEAMVAIARLETDVTAADVDTRRRLDNLANVIQDNAAQQSAVVRIRRILDGADLTNRADHHKASRQVREILRQMYGEEIRLLHVRVNAYNNNVSAARFGFMMANLLAACIVLLAVFMTKS